MSEKEKLYLTRDELHPINTGESDREYMEHEIKRIFNRHIAKCLGRLGDTIAPVQVASIKRSFRFLEEDISTLVINGEQNDQEQYYNDTFGR